MVIRDVVGDRAEAVVSISSAAPLSDAVELLKSENIGALPVVDGAGALVGLISERDVVHAMGQDGVVDPTVPVDQVMSKNIVDCEFDTPIETALRLMRMLHIRHLPVTAEKSPVGIVSLRDIAFWRMENIEDEVKKLQYSEQGYWDFIEKSPDAIIVELDAHIAFANQTAANIFAAASVDELIGTRVDELYDAQDGEEASRTCQIDVAEGEWLPFLEARFVRFDGTPFPGELTATEIWWSGKSARLIAVRDISNRKRVAAELSLKDGTQLG